MVDFWQGIIEYANRIDVFEFLGLIFGLLTVWLLIKENILTWPVGIAYVLISFVIFYRTRLYADFALHIVFLILNIYGWYFWVKGRRNKNEGLPVSTTSAKMMLWVSTLSIAGIFVIAEILKTTDAAVPYWDSATTSISIGAMWLQARKKIESWYFWILVDLLATGIYINREIYLFLCCTLWCVYIYGFLRTVFLAKINANMKRVAIVGPESTGKTTLARQLAKKFNTKPVKEYAREFLEKNPHYVEKDLVLIARKQYALVEEADDNKKGILFIDTDITVIKIWSLVKYGRCDQEIEGLLTKQQIDFYLLMYPDIPWVFDQQRESKDSLMKLFKLYDGELTVRKKPFAIIKGSEENRLSSALVSISEHFPTLNI